MKKNIAQLLAILLSLNSIIIQADAPKNETATKAVAKKEITPIKSGDSLVSSEFTKTNDGIMYKIVKKGSGAKPLQGETLVVHYSGFLLNEGKKVGLKFDSSLDRNMPFSFKLGARQVIRGWDISLADMKVGETRIVILPAKHGYGNRATSKIPADSSLIFEITLVKAS